MEFYCVKCRNKVDVAEGGSTFEDNGNRRIYKAKCPQCGTKVAKFGRVS